MSSSGYSPVPLDNFASQIETVTNNLEAAEKILINRATRWVLFLCLVQSIMCFFSMFAGHLFQVWFGILFISMGIIGVKKQNIKLLTAHFVYSIITYILTLIGIVLVVLYCDQRHAWWVYITGFFLILFQAIGMKHSKRMICLLKKRQLGDQVINCEAHKCMMQEINIMIENAAPEAQSQNIAMYPIPNQQFMAMQMQPDQQVPSYFPMVIPYPMMQPMNVNYGDGEENQSQQPMSLYPVNYQV